MVNFYQIFDQYLANIQYYFAIFLLESLPNYITKVFNYIYQKPCEIFGKSLTLN